MLRVSAILLEHYHETASSIYRLIPSRCLALNSLQSILAKLKHCYYFATATRQNHMALPSVSSSASPLIPDIGSFFEIIAKEKQGLLGMYET